MTGGVSAACAPTKLFVTNNRRCILRHITQYKPLTNAYTRHFIRESAGEDFQVINPAGIELIRLQPSGLLAEMAEETVTFDFEDSLLGSGVFIWPTWQHFNHVLSTLVQSVTLDYSSMLIGLLISASQNTAISSADLRRLARLQVTHICQHQTAIHQLIDTKQPIFNVQLSSHSILNNQDGLLLQLKLTADQIHYYLIAPNGDRQYRMSSLLMHPDKLMNLSRAFQCLLPLVDASFAVSPRVVAAETPAKKLADMKLFSSPAINAAENNHQLIPKDLKNHFRLVLENAIAESFVLGKLD